MAAGKESFVLYRDLIEVVKELSTEQRSELFTVILEYVNDLDPQPVDQVVKIAFAPIRQQLKRDLVRWRETVEKRSEAGKKGGLASGQSRSKQAEANEANASKSKQNEANEAVYVSEYVPVSVSDTVTKEKSIKKKSESFDQFWNTYGYKVGKPNAEKAWSKMSQSEQQEALAVVPMWRAAYGDEYLPHPATWLNQKRWTDDINALSKRRIVNQNGHTARPLPIEPETELYRRL